MPAAKFDGDQTSQPNSEPQLEPVAPSPRRKGWWIWVVFMVLLLAVLAGILTLSAKAQFYRDYDRALNNIMLQQGVVVATLGAGK